MSSEIVRKEAFEAVEHLQSVLVDLETKRLEISKSEDVSINDRVNKAMLNGFIERTVLPMLKVYEGRLKRNSDVSEELENE